MKNATITAITAPNAPDEAGKVTFPADVTVRVRGYLTEVTAGMRIAIGASIEKATGVVIIKGVELPAAVAAPLKGCRVVVTPDLTSASEAYVVEEYRRLDKPGFVWHQAFVRKA